MMNDSEFLPTPGLPVKGAQENPEGNEGGFPAPFSLQGEVALVTGGGSGLGLAIARCMAEAGARVVLIGRRQEVLDQAVASIGSDALGIVHDVTRLDSLPQLVAQVEAQAGPLS